MDLRRTTRYWRRNLPHWEVENAAYFVTARCADSLPADVVARLAEIHHELSSLDARSPQFAALQRRSFATMEKYLDAGYGACLLRETRVAQVVVDEFNGLEAVGVTVPHFTVMPNHWHAILVPMPGSRVELGTIMKRIKGRSARAIRGLVGGRGAVWQREWFDRWLRDEGELQRCRAYIRNNPVKAGLVRRTEDHAFTQ